MAFPLQTEDPRWPIARLTRRVAVVAGLVLCLPWFARAAEEPLEYQVKAAFLFNFTKFVEWPASALPGPGAPLAICLLGDDPFGRTLDQIVQGESVGSRKIVVRRLRRPPASNACQVLYINRAEKDIAQVIKGLGPGVLTVGEGESFLQEGGIIAFVLDNRRVRFDIHSGAAADALLKISSRLLTVARSVTR